MKSLLVLLAVGASFAAQAQNVPNADPKPALKPASKPAPRASFSRFTRETTEDINLHLETDHETGCRYLIAEGQGITPLLKSNGTPDCSAPKLGE
ncbi:DUF6440 family protein [Caballeronia sp. dw_276]|jgi:hypothetical protein|uniref:DUF6440 family protein n=1 Tax=Caballeronia sp. dw_276 TaxID=2719795 RepID=UPI001BD593AB|nr:DUF6440 family protein [Caballeronia sp. dw_276]